MLITKTDMRIGKTINKDHKMLRATSPKPGRAQGEPMLPLK